MDGIEIIMMVLCCLFALLATGGLAAFAMLTAVEWMKDESNG